MCDLQVNALVNSSTGDSHKQVYSYLDTSNMCDLQNLHVPPFPLIQAQGYFEKDNPKAVFTLQAWLSMASVQLLGTSACNAVHGIMPGSRCCHVTLNTMCSVYT